MNLVDKILKGERLALSRLISKIENQTEEGLAVLDELFPYTGRAHLIGITGSPGSGKSSLVNQVVHRLLQQGGDRQNTIAVIAVDPTSPFSGGALLGDRVRMRDLMTNPNIFIRSMASRGAMGGLAQTTGQVAQVLDAAGFDVILIETVGAGQTEVEIAGLAHTVIVVEAPGMGDDIQAIKAGILEIANILVVNKSDLSGAENTVRSLRSMLELARPDLHRSHDVHHEEEEFPAGESETHFIGWSPPVVQTIATRGEGIDKLLDEISRHKAYLVETCQKGQIDLKRLTKEINQMIKENLYSDWKDTVPQAVVDDVLKKVEHRQISPQTAVRMLLKAGLDNKVDTA